MHGGDSRDRRAPPAPRPRSPPWEKGRRGRPATPPDSRPRHASPHTTPSQPAGAEARGGEAEEGAAPRAREAPSGAPPSPPSPRPASPSPAPWRTAARRPPGGEAERPRREKSEGGTDHRHAPGGRSDKPLCRGLTFNRSQRGSCSATYETPTQKQVVYEWFSTRFPTNVRCVTGEGRPPFRPRPVSRDEGLSAPDPGPDARRGAPRRAPRDAGDGPPAGTAGDRLSEANRGSRGAAVSFRLGGILT